MSRIPTLIAGLLLWGVAPPTMSQDIPDMEREGPPTIEVKTGGMDHLEGFFDLYWDEREGKLYWEIDRWESEFLYQVSLASGIGSNPVGLDRGELGGTHLLVARRVGVPANTYHAAVQRVAQRALLDRLIEQAGFKGNTPAVRAVLSAKIAELGAWLEEHTEESAHNALALEDILRWQDRPEGITAPSEVLERPAGQPIGG